MKNVKLFKNEKFVSGLRAIINKEGEPLFVGKDVATILGYTNTRKAIRDHVDIEDKFEVQLSDIQEGNETFLSCKSNSYDIKEKDKTSFSYQLSDIQEGSETRPPCKSSSYDIKGEKIFPSHMKGSKIVIINESGLYSLIFNSKLDAAKEFKRWVTSEVLPSIRKTGKYISENEVSKKKKRFINRLERNKIVSLLKEAILNAIIERLNVLEVNNNNDNIKVVIKIEGLSTPKSYEFICITAKRTVESVVSNFKSVSKFLKENNIMIHPLLSVETKIPQKWDSSSILEIYILLSGILIKNILKIYLDKK